MSLVLVEPHNSTRSPIRCKCRKGQPRRTFFCAVDKVCRPAGNASVSENSWHQLHVEEGERLGVEIADIVGSCGRQHYLSSRNTRKG